MKIRSGVAPRRSSRSRWTAFLLSFAALALAGTYLSIRFAKRPAHDLLIRDAMVHDGSGAPPYTASVGVDGDVITAIYPARAPDLFLRPNGRTTIDAEGLDLAPGFIDTHTHADQNIVASSGVVRANNFIGQGVTTIITGNCGRSPVHIGRFAGSIAARGTNVNVATLVGLNSVRAEVMNSSTAHATPAEIARMCRLVDAAMRDGAAGVSTGAAYVPGRFASEEETVAQVAVAGRYGGIYATHLRDEGNGIIDSIREALRHSAKAHVALLISHFKIVGPANCAKYPFVERMLALGRKEGIPVYSDQYPYAASSSSLDLYLPDWFVGTRGAARRAILDTPAGQARLGSYFRQRISTEGFKDLGFAYVASYEDDTALAGLNVAQVAQKMGKPATVDGQIETVFDLLRHGGAQMVYHNICNGLTSRIAAQPTSMFGSDSAIRYSGGDYLPHPRGWGAFPRVIAHLVRREHALSLEEAIRKMTSLPATVFGLERRGLIRRGYYADLVIFDAAAISDRATYRSPFLPPRGIVHVVVNGRITVTESQSQAKRLRGVPDILPVLAGRFLPRALDARTHAPRARRSSGS